jgi:hypothetical protein
MIISKNISMNLRKEKTIPYKETYLTIRSFQKNVNLHQKFSDSRRNQKIDLNFEECKRLMNLLAYYAFKGKYKYSKDQVIIYRNIQ